MSPNFKLKALYIPYLLPLIPSVGWLLLCPSLASCGGGAAPSAPDNPDTGTSQPVYLALLLDTDFDDIQADAGIFFKVDLGGYFIDDVTLWNGEI